MGWPTLCKALQGHFSWRRSQEHPTKRGRMKGCIGHSSVGPSLCPTHTPRPLLLQEGIQASASGPISVHVPTTLRAALGMQRSSAYTPWNSEPQTQWDSLWLKAILMVKTRIYGHTLPCTHLTGPDANKLSVKGHFPRSWKSWAGPGYQVSLACDNSTEIMWKTGLTIHAEVFTREKLKLSRTH